MHLRSETAKMWLKRLKTIAVVLFYLFDFVSDIINGAQFIRNGHPLWGSLCLGLVAVPGIVHGVWELSNNGCYSEGLLSFLKYSLFGSIILPFRTVKG